jgi:cystine transport system substrate-binding protein
MKITLLGKLLVIGITGALLSAAAHAEDLLDTVKQRGTLQIALEGTFPPFDYKAPNGELDGYDVDVAKAVAAKLGVKPVFVTTEWSGIIAGLQAKRYDVIVNQVSITPERQKALDFSPPYTYSTAQLIQRKDDTRQFKTLDELKGHKLGVSLGSNYNDMAKSVPGIDVRTYPGAPEYLRDLADGRIDAALNDVEPAAAPGRQCGRRSRRDGHPVPQGQSEVRQGDGRRYCVAQGRRHAHEDLAQVVRH